MVPALVDKRRDFHNARRSLWATHAPRMCDTGRLDEHWQERWRRDFPRIAYVVYSYQTPIGWVLHDGSVLLVDQKFSVTTSRHQTLVALGL
ncbi:hypothetical protein [Longimycelium tulufanense]|nr:hypothetical protein [Longimycelium tulufanense]